MSIYREEIASGVILTDDNVSSALIPAATDDMWLYIDRIEVSVYLASAEDTGIMELLDSDGNHVGIMSVSSIKERSFEFGNSGLRIGQSTGLQVLLSGASRQASVSLVVVWHLGAE